MLTAVDRGALLAENGIFVLEQGAGEEVLLQVGALHLQRERRYGAARVCLYTQEEQG